MTRSRAAILVMLLLVAAATWWLLPRAEPEASGRVTVEWQGSRQGSVVLPAQLAWCPINRVGTLEAISNDTGLIVTLLEVDSLGSGSHPVIAAELRDQSPRPTAVSAFRWVSDSGELLGFRSVSGMVEVSSATSLASGSFEMRMRAPVGVDTLVIRGEFVSVPITAGAVGCP